MKNSLNKLLLWAYIVGKSLGSPDVSAAPITPAQDATKPLTETLVVKDKLPTDFLKANFTVNATSANNLLIKDNWDNAYELSYDYKFEGIKWFSDWITLGLKTNVVLSYENNNVYVKFEETIFPKQVEVVVDGKEIVVNDVVYNVATVTEPGKGIDVRIIPDLDKTEKRVLDKIALLTSEVTLDIEEVPELENLQLTWLEDITLGEEIFKEKDGYYRVLFMKEGNEYRPVRKIYFDIKGNGDAKKTTDGNKPIKVLGEELTVSISVDKSVMKIKTIDNLDKVQARITAHQAKLIEMINKAKIGSPEVFVGANKEQKERPWSNSEEVFSFDTKTLNIKLINDTYIFQWGADETQVIRFGVKFNKEDPSKDQLILKDIVGKEVTSFDLKVSEDFYTVRIENGYLVIDKIKNSNDVLTNAFPQITGDATITTTFSSETGLKTYVNKEDKANTFVQYFNANGKKVASFPSTLTDKGLWELGQVSINVNPLDLYNQEVIDASGVDLSSLNLTQQDLQNVFKSLLTSEKVKLQWRKVVAVYNIDANKYEYYTVDQKNDGTPYVLTKDADLYTEANDILKGIAGRLKMVSMVKASELRWTNDGKDQRFEGFVGGGWGLEKAPLKTSNILDFLKDKTDLITQTVVWGEGSKTDIPYVINDGKVKLDAGFLQSKIKSPISGQYYTVRAWFNGQLIKVTFDPIEKKK